MITITIAQEDDAPEINSATVKHLINTILSDYHIREADINIVFGSDELLNKLKREYFAEDVYTDVIAFILNDDKNHLEGEIYISPERSAENALSYGVTFANEMSRLIIHGTLHLLGWKDDNTQQKKTMREEENRFLADFDETRLITGEW
ncbi:MAG: rRNA maturation RNase YbeY [Fidelibacterota bacterium]